MELKFYFGVIKKWWWLVVVSMLVAAGTSYLAISRVPRIFQATTTIMVGQQNPTESSDWREIRQWLGYLHALVPRSKTLERAGNTLEPPYIPSPGNVSARIVEGSPFLEISVRDGDPELARLLADAIAQQLVIQFAEEATQDGAELDFAKNRLLATEQDIQTTEDEITAKKAELAEANSARTIRELQTEITALEDKRNELLNTYANLLQAVKQEANFITIYEPAITPFTPISPNVRETVLLAAAIGAALALAGAFLIEFLDDTIKTPDDVTRAADLTTLGLIAKIKGKGYKDKLVPIAQPHSPITEAYRTLRTNIQVSSIDEPIRTLLVTSPNPREGKSTTAANLGVVMAQTGKSVIVVDSDLRRSALHQIFQTSNQVGLTDVLLQEDLVLDGLLQQTEVENLRVLTSGPLPPNPSELLGSQKMRRLVEELKKEADIIIFDTPPVLPVTDTMVLALQTDGILIVAEAGHTRRTAIKKTVENLRQVGTQVLGIALNRLSSRHLKGYNYYYYSDKGQRKRRARPWYQRIPLVGRLFSR